MPKWQPIETAPKSEGVLTFGPDGLNVAFCYDGAWLQPCPDNQLWLIEPTHWMPLPEPPSDG